jgi:hypothetical protein
MTLRLVQSEVFLLDLEGQFHWYILPFNRFLIYYHVEHERLLVDRLVEGHRRITTDRGEHN